LACQARSSRDQRRADGRGRPGDILGDGCGRDEPPAADQDAGEFPGTEKPVNGVAGDAAEELSSFLDGVEHAVLHGSLAEGRGRPDVIRPSRQLITVDRVVLTTLRVSQVNEKREFVGFLPQYLTMFSESSGRTTQILRRTFHPASKKSISSGKSALLIGRRPRSSRGEMEHRPAARPSVSLGVIRMTPAGSNRGPVTPIV
jgi:hypothetical protein